MSYLNTMDWDKLRVDAVKGLKQGLVAVKKGAMVARKRAGALTEEGKRQYKLIALKIKAHNGIYDLGVRVYSLIAAKAGKNPARDAQVKDIAAHLKRYEAEIALLEKTSLKSSKQRIGKNA